MRNFFITLILISALSLPALSEVMQGGVQKEGITGRNRVVDSLTNAPIKGAKVSLPLENYSTYTDSKGKFALDANFDGQTVLSVEKPGYKPFSITLDKEAASKPIIMGIEKSTPQDIAVETSMFHLGDNNYSDLSANARQFQVKSVGPYYSKDFKIGSVAPGSKVTLTVGSIIGVDTQMAKSLGQNKVTGAYASPPEVFFNGNKIADIQVNGDGQKIRIPSSLIRQNQLNEITIKTGRNMMQTDHVDYDDIEFMNLTVDVNDSAVAQMQ